MLTTLNLPGRPLHTFGRWDENAEKLHTFGRWNGHGGGRNAATVGSRGGSASAHLLKVRRKCGKIAHLRKVERAWWREKRSYSRLSWGLCFYAPSEGEAKMRKNSTPSEGGTDMVAGETRLQQALVGLCLCTPSEGETG